MIEVRDKNYESRHHWIRDHYVIFNKHIAKVSPEDAVELLKFNDIDLIGNYICKFNPKTWTTNYKKLHWEANADTFSGFGSVTSNVVKTLAKLGVDVTCSGQKYDEKSFPDDEFKEYLKPINPDCITIQYRQPGQFRRKISERIFGYTPWETTRIPQSWVSKMNEMEAIFTTCKQNIEAFRDSGVKVPIHLFYHGIDSKQFPYVERKKDTSYVFGTFGRLSIRKGTDLLVKAFTEEFKTEKDVFLVLKSTDVTIPFGGNNDERIIRIGEVMGLDDLIVLLKTFDCFVFPSRGEGFGLPPFQAMATGLPTIMTNWSGLADFGDKNDTLLLDYKMVKAENFTKQIYKEDCGDWAEPDLKQLKTHMRWCYEHREEAKEMGRKASERIHRDWTWELKTKEFIKQLDKII